MRNHIVIFLALILIQFWLGMTINLELNLSASNYSGQSALLFYVIHYPLILAHMLVGIAILAVSVSFMIFSFQSSLRSLIITGIIGFAGIVGAFYNGIMFLLSGGYFGNSIGMAMSAVSAIVAYSVSLYYVGVISSEDTSPRI